MFTLLRDEDMRHFKAMIRKADNNYVKDHKLPPEQVGPGVALWQEGLSQSERTGAEAKARFCESHAPDQKLALR